MLTTSRKQLDDHLKEAYKCTLLTHELKQHARYQEPQITYRISLTTSVCEGS